MKQLLPLFLFLLPCLALAQYPSNGNQKITLGEQTTADGLIYRGVLADTGIITPLSDTSAYIILDTVNHRFYNYNRTTNVWSVAGGGTAVTSITGGTGLTGGTITTSGTLAADTSFLFTQSDTLSLNLTSRFAAKQNNLTLTTTGTSGAATLVGATLNVPNYAGGGVSDGDKGDIDVTNSGATWTIDTSAISLSGNKVTGTLPVANGGTGASSFSPNNYLIRTNSSGIFDTSAVYEIGGNVGIGTATPTTNLNVVASAAVSGVGNGIQINKGAAGFAVVGFGGRTSFAAGNAMFYSDENYLAINSRAGSHLYFNFDNSNAASNIDFFQGKVIVKQSGNVGIGQTTPTAVLHLKAGTATASTAPLKFTSGTNLTTAEAGAVEFDGTNLLFTPSTTRHTVNHGLTGSATLDFGSTNAQLSTDLTITVTGASDGDVVSLGVPNAAVNANTSYSAWVSASNTVTVRFNNYSSGTVNPASGTFKVFVTK
jgi:hypothetical protein